MLLRLNDPSGWGQMLNHSRNKAGLLSLLRVPGLSSIAVLYPE